ncbi:MAG: TetR family transcriptional regulator [Phycisphaera sp.]|nr:TetR family transcriptional regulator [Phycisphaera sp.]
MSHSDADPTAADLLGAPEIPKQGRDRLVAVAIELFYRHGFNATGLDRVIAEAGVSKTTFYKHFTSKTELMVAAVEWRDKYERRAWDRAVKMIAGECPRGQLRAYFQVLDRWFNEPDFHGCIFLNTAAEFPNPNDPVHKAAAAHKLAFRAHVRELALQAGAMDPDPFADAYVTMFEGTLIVRQTYGRNDAAKQVMPMIDTLIRQYMPDAEAAPAANG